MKITAVPSLAEGILASKPNQPSISESPSQVPAVADPKEGELSSKYAEFAKKEKALRNKIQAERAALEVERKAFKDKEAEYANTYIPKTRISELFQKDPTQAMREFGINGDLVTQGLLNQPSAEHRMIEELRAEIQALKGTQDQTKTLFEQRDKQAREQALNQIRADIKTLVNSDPNFDTIKNTGDDAIEEILTRLEKKFDETGELIPIEQLATEVEEEFTEGFLKYARLKKIQERLQKAAEVSAPELKPVQAPTKTLAHSQVSSAQKPMSARERAIAILEGKTI